MEGDAVAQAEGLDGAILGNLPGLGQGWLDLQRARRVAHHPVLKVHQDAKIIDRRDGMRIQRLRFGNLPDDQNTGRGLGACRCDKPRCRKQGGCENPEATPGQ